MEEHTGRWGPVIIHPIHQKIDMLKAKGCTVLLVVSNFQFAATVADRHYIMEHGRMIDQFSTPELKANTEKLHDYLGV